MTGGIDALITLMHARVGFRPAPSRGGGDMGYILGVVNSGITFGGWGSMGFGVWESRDGWYGWHKLDGLIRVCLYAACCLRFGQR